MVNKFEKILATVSGQTPPETGVISFTKSFKFSKSIHYIENINIL